MALNVRYGDRVERLADDLAAWVRSRRLRGDPFETLRVAAPNRTLAQWLRIELTRRLGHCIGIDFPFLDRALWDLSAPGGRPAAGDAPLEADTLQRAIAAVLTLHPDPALAPLRAYLDNEGQPASAGFPGDISSARRLWQLAGRLAAYLREYEFQRTDLVQAWLLSESRQDGPAGSASAGPPTLADAQRCLYLRLFGRHGLWPWEDGRRTLLQRHAALARAAPVAPPAGGGPAQAQVEAFFGFSILSPLHAMLLYELGRTHELVLFHLTVCLEYWGDIQSPWERLRKARRTRDDQGERLDLAIENDLLNAWGLAGRETLNLLTDLEESGSRVECVDVGGEEPPAGSVLDALQQSVRRRTSDLPRLRQDPSLQIVACPGIQREVEMVHNSILGSLHDPGRLRTARDGLSEAAPSDGGPGLSDIAVLVTDMPTYRPVIEAVFDARGGFPYGLIDSNAAETSLYARGLLTLLRAADRPFSRKDVFEILENPCVRAALGVTREMLEVWREWASRLGVFHGFDAAHLGRRNLPESTRFTWHQALARIRLGRWTDDPEASGPFGPPHVDLHTGGLAGERFSWAVEALFRGLDAVARGAPSATEWRGRLLGLMDRFLAIPDDLGGEQPVRSRIVEVLDRLADPRVGLDAIARAAAGGEREPAPPRAPEARAAGLPLATVRTYLEDALGAVPCGRGGYLTHGVTVASLQPMRPVPFRQIYILGLGEGCFPGIADASTLDLRAHRRRIGDTSRPDADRHLFLETVLSARERLVLSYNAEDLRKDERKFPGSLVQQLKRFVSAHILPQPPQGGVEPFREVALPLDEADPRCLDPSADPSAWDAGIVLSWSVEARLLQGVRRWGHPHRQPDAGPWPALRQALAQSAPRGSPASAGGASRRDHAVGRLRAVLAPCPLQPPSPPRPARSDAEGVAAVRLRDLADFLIDPALAVLRRRLRLHAPRLPDCRAENEPLDCDSTHWPLVFATVTEAWRSPDPDGTAPRAFDRRYRELQRSSLAPGDALGALDREAHLADIARILGGLAPDDWFGPRQTLRGLLFGEARPREPGAVERRRCVLPNVGDDARLLELDGELPLFASLDAGRGAVALQPTRTTAAANPLAAPSEDLYAPLLGLLAERAASPEESLDTPLHVVLLHASRGKVSARTWTYRAVTPGIARTYLSALATAFLDCREPGDLLPSALIGHLRARLVECASGRPDEAVLDAPAEWLDANDELRERLRRDFERALAEQGRAFAGYRLREPLRLIKDQLAPPRDTAATIWRRHALPWLGQYEHAGKALP